MATQLDAVIFILCMFSAGFFFGWLLGLTRSSGSARGARGTTVHLPAIPREISRHHHLQSGPLELFFFPDGKLPCDSWLNDTKYCWNKQRNKKCDKLHPGDDSSLMEVLKTIRDANKIDLCIFRFTLEGVAKLLINLHNKGTKIRIITDRPHAKIEKNQIPDLVKSGIAVRETPLDPKGTDDHRPLMHNKFVIVDQKCCLLGSFNWTAQAVMRNSEAIVKFCEPKAVNTMLKRFELMWEELKVAEY